MKRLFQALIDESAFPACFVFVVAAAIPLRGAEIIVEVDPPSENPVVVTVYDSPNAFGDLRDPIRTEKCEDDQPCAVAELDPGEYALVVFADSNGNQILDRNFLGIPTEAIGFANDYRPKGPPIWERARVVLAPRQSRTITVTLERPLGDRGRIGVGPGILLRTSPYREDDGLVAQPIPAITWQGNRVQILGPRAQVGILGTDRLRLAATVRFRIGVYEEDDSPVLAGLDDRDGTVMAGLAFVAELPRGLELELGYGHDVLDRIGGGEAQLSLGKSFQSGKWIFTPEMTAQWTSSDLSSHDFGVPVAAARPGRPAYSTGSTLNYGIGLSAFVEISRSWGFFGTLGGVQLDDAIRDSPIVDEDYVIDGFFGLSYLF